MYNTKTNVTVEKIDTICTEKISQLLQFYTDTGMWNMS